MIGKIITATEAPLMLSLANRPLLRESLVASLRRRRSRPLQLTIGLLVQGHLGTVAQVSPPVN